MVEEIKQEIKEEKPTLIEDAIKSAERLEKATSDLKVQLDRQERIIAQEKLGGRTRAGEAVKTESEEEKAKREIIEIMKPTGFNPFK